MIRLFLAALVVMSSCGPTAPATQAGPNDWRDESIYFVMTDRFRNGDPRNDADAVPGRADWWQGGDLQGLIDELQYIKDLGMTAIWITPITQQTRGGYHGYWTADFYRVDPHLGDLLKLKELVTKAHAMRLKVLLDVVINHVGYDNPWLVDSAHAGWFHDRCTMIFSDQKSVEDCWLAGLPDLNTENPAVRAYLTDWALWLIRETNVDGFRLDTARHVPKDFLHDWVAAIKREHPNFWIGGEVFSSDYRYQADYLKAGLDAITDFQTQESIRRGLGAAEDLTWIGRPPSLAETYLPGREAARMTFIDNHDVDRFVGPTDNADARARLRQALVYLFTVPGTPVLYYGTEIALPGGGDPDNRRAMPWTDGDETTRDLVRQLATLRQQIPSLRRGSFVKLLTERETLVYAREGGADTAVVAINGQSDAPQTLELPLADIGAHGAVLHRTLGPNASAVVRGDSLLMTLGARGAAVFLLGAGEASAPPWTMIVALAVLLLAAATLMALTLRRHLRRG
ncbi:MAG: alpha-amlyase [Chloroflexi bacterium]|nr:MAG: alpha-amlyase [Chloroflexota bacterium]